MLSSLTLEQLEAVALAREPLVLAPAERHRVEAAHAFLLERIAGHQRIYGVTTGYGPLASTYVAPEQSVLLQQNLVYHLCSGVGEPLAIDQVRALMAARLISLCQGHSGVSLTLVERVLLWLEKGVTPEIPARGTVGASGDLTPLAHLARALGGEGRVSVKGGPWMASAEAHRQLGMTPLVLAHKDAIALVNGTSVTAGIAALNAVRAQRAVKLGTLLVLLYAELLEGHREAFHPGIGAIRPHAGQQQLHRWLWTLSAASRALEPAGAATLPDTLEHVARDQPLPQDAYTLRCAPQALGAAWDVCMQHAATVTTELASVSDNPLLFPEEALILHGGNFFGQHLAFASDHLNTAVVQMALYSERRIARITDPVRSKGLPAFMQPRDTGLHSGFMGAQVSATALVAELRSHAMPASIQSIPTNADNQDIVPLGTVAARRVATSLDQLYSILAIEALVLAQAVDIRGQEALSPASQALHAWVRQRAATLEADRPLCDEIESVAQALIDPQQVEPLMALLVESG